MTHAEEFRAAIHSAGLHPPAIDIGEHRRARAGALAGG